MAELRKKMKLSPYRENGCQGPELERSLLNSGNQKRFHEDKIYSVCVYMKGILIISFNDTIGGEAML